MPSDFPLGGHLVRKLAVNRTRHETGNVAFQHHGNGRRSFLCSNMLKNSHDQKLQNSEMQKCTKSYI
ncbi:hypothetical protein DA2_2233 [Desulfovibrio sp. A2]|nr:hypothetical protein DA2_2233 [Desulfovibrio sp. A2]